VSPIHALWVVALCLAVSVARAESIQARVVGVTDGDTVAALTSEKRQIKVRLAGIDTPEKKQPFGTAAKQALSDLAFGRDAVIEYEKEDRYGRTVGKVLVDGRDVNLELVTRGFAWWYRKYANEQSAEDRALYEAAENAARAASRGLWSDPQPIPPWEWRKR
jgi:endonuclease YncB( thermonuclease family)